MRRTVVVHQMTRLRSVHPVEAAGRRKPSPGPGNHVEIRMRERVKLTRCHDHFAAECREGEHARVSRLPERERALCQIVEEGIGMVVSSTVADFPLACVPASNVALSEASETCGESDCARRVGRLARRSRWWSEVVR